MKCFVPATLLAAVFFIVTPAAQAAQSPGGIAPGMSVSLVPVAGVPHPDVEAAPEYLRDLVFALPDEDSAASVLALAMAFAQPPSRTVVPANPVPGRPNHGVEWVPSEGAAFPAIMPAPPPSVAVTTAADLSIRLVVTVRGEDHVVELPAETIGQVLRAIAPEVIPTRAPVPAPAPAVPVARGGAARISPAMPAAGSGGVYRVQVGAFSRTALARECFDRLAGAGLSPAFERFDGMYRVVLPGVPAGDMGVVAQRLGNAGFSEAWIRRESN